MQAGQEKIGLLLLGVQPEGFLGVSQGLLHIPLALVESGQLHLQEGGFGIVGQSRLIFLDGPGGVFGHQQLLGFEEVIEGQAFRGFRRDGALGSGGRHPAQRGAPRERQAQADHYDPAEEDAGQEGTDAEPNVPAR